MSFTVYKPPPRENNTGRTMSPPALYVRRSDKAATFYANASLMVQLRSDANRIAVSKTGDRIEETDPIHVVMLVDKQSGLFGLAATVEGDPNATLMRLNQSRKGVVPGGVRIADDLGMGAGRYPTREAKIEGAIVRVTSFRSDGGS